MSLQTRATAAAGGLRAATPVDVEAGLARLRRTHHRRTATRVAGAALVVAAVVGAGALALDGTDRAAPPVDRGPVENRDPSPGGIVHGVAPGPAGTPSSEVLSLPDAGAASFPAWQAFDQDTGRFLFSGFLTVETQPEGQDIGLLVRTMRVLAPGLEKPVATIHCVEQCNWLHSFGPGRDEVTTLVSPVMRGRRMAQVWGFDGVLRDEIDLSGVLYGRGVADLEWSPDGSRLAVSTFWGAWEPDCPGEPPTRAGVPNDGRVYLFDRAGGDPELVYRQRAQRPLDLPPILTDLAWSPDGERLGLVSSTYCRNEPKRLGVTDAARPRRRVGPGKDASPVRRHLQRLHHGHPRVRVVAGRDTHRGHQRNRHRRALLGRATPHHDPRQRHRPPGLARPVGLSKRGHGSRRCRAPS